jgi:hypothetical protein
MAKESSIDKGATSSSGSGGGEEISLNMPRKSSHDVYLILVSNTLSAYKQIIFTLAGTTDPRVIPATRQCILQIIDDDIRSKLLKALAKGIDYVQTRDDLNPGDKGALTIEICQNAVAQVYSYLDEYIGLSKVNALVSVSSIPTKEEEEAAQEILDSEKDMPDETDDPTEAPNNVAHSAMMETQSGKPQ